MNEAVQHLKAALESARDGALSRLVALPWAIALASSRFASAPCPDCLSLPASAVCVLTRMCEGVQHVWSGVRVHTCCMPRVHLLTLRDCVVCRGVHSARRVAGRTGALEARFDLQPRRQVQQGCVALQSHSAHSRAGLSLIYLLRAAGTRPSGASCCRRPRLPFRDHYLLARSARPNACLCQARPAVNGVLTNIQP